MRVFITGVAGFIGFHLARRLLADGHQVTGFDGVTPYYDPGLKRARLAELMRVKGFDFTEAMLEDAAVLEAAVAASRSDWVVHLAAQPGVRHSIDQPHSYVQSNLVGTVNLLESLRAHPPRHFLFASTSSVYGGNTQLPFAETDRADGPISLYAATKKAGEAMAHAYSHLWSIATTAVRFFTVYGPWSRPDMASIRFATAIEQGQPIDVYGGGRMRRDFTYVDDLVEAMVRLLAAPPVMGAPVDGDSLSAVAPFRTVNVGGGRPTELMDFIAAMEVALGRKAVLNLLPQQQGDPAATEADTTLLHALVGPLPETPLAEGLARFAEWFRADATRRDAATRIG